MSSISNEEKALTIVGLVLKSMVEEGKWREFTVVLIEHVKNYYACELPENFAQIGVENAARLLVELLGDNRAVAAAYHSEEVIEGQISDEDYATDSDSSEGEEREQETGNTRSELEDTEDLDRSGRETKISIEFEEEENYQNQVPEQYGKSEESLPISTPHEAAADQTKDATQKTEDKETDAVPVSLTEGQDYEKKERYNGDECDGCESSPISQPSNDDSDLPLSSKSYEPPNFKKAVERQAALLVGALRDPLISDQDQTLSIENVQYQLERFIFNPPRGLPLEHAEVRYNFHPPFLTPKAICNYHVFATTAPIPLSCKANRSGTQLLEAVRKTDCFKNLPKWRLSVEIDDTLGTEVMPVGELKDEVKLVPLTHDVSRVQWAKSRGEHVRYFSYPSLHIPPKISRMLMETLLQPFADENNKYEDVEPCLSDGELACIVDPDNVLNGNELIKAIQKRRTMVAMAVRYCSEMELMQRVFREPSSVKKFQEVLHHTLHRGYVQVVREVGKVNLSNYATFHGITYNSPLNNCIMANLLEGQDKEDYVVDSIYLLLVLTWQTAMGMWQQAIDDKTTQIYASVFKKHIREIYAKTSISEMSAAIIDILMDSDHLTQEMRKAIPNFTTLSQLSAFRQFLLERSNIPSIAAPFLPSDFIPLAYRQSPPLLWSHVYLLNTAYFLLNHGGYLWEPEGESLSQKTYCPCNLCSPHRMPRDNMALHNEMLAIGTFELHNSEGKVFKLTPELWANAYLDRFVPEDYHPFKVIHYCDNEDRFTKDRVACVAQSPEVLSLIRQIEQNREEFLLKKGKGVYKDPNTGETISHCPIAPSRAGPADVVPLPAAESAKQRRTTEAQGHSKAVWSKPVILQRQQHGSENVRELGESGRRAGSPNCRRRDRRRVPRKPGHGGRRGGGRGEQSQLRLRRGGGGGTDEPGPDHSSIPTPSEKENTCGAEDRETQTTTEKITAGL